MNSVFAAAVQELRVPVTKCRTWQEIRRTVERYETEMETIHKRQAAAVFDTFAECQMIGGAENAGPENAGPENEGPMMSSLRDQNAGV